ncbi:hypothetical protein HMPREF1982_01657 [Clostridiales bacterium oral taxon 876 str. F0540]|nr:hypothetical protein HMPREF1982_01657 [Clostridiales bacterium oral taxon 876 str. F0540]
MVRFYLRIQNNMLVKNLLYIVVLMVSAFNIAVRLFPQKFIYSLRRYGGLNNVIIVPKDIYTYCDVYLLLLFIILIYFFLGTDFNNSMEEIALAVGGSRTNKFMLRKLGAILGLYIILYSITFANIYSLYNKLIPGGSRLLPFNEIAFYSITTNIFIISLSLLILFITRNIAVSTSLITAYYLIEEALWRCKITQEKGILGHIYQYFDCPKNDIIKIKLFYIVLSIVFLFFTYIISKRKVHFKISVKNSSRS